MSLDPQLSRLQARLLQSLADGVPGDRLREEIRATAPCNVVVRWAQAWDEDLLELAGVLVRTWARRAPNTGAPGWAEDVAIASTTSWHPERG